MTVAGDVGSGTGSEPMVRYGEKPQRRETPYKRKKKEKKMKSFRDFAKDQEVTESPVGQVGRTKDSEALAHIENSDVAKRFRKIVRELGGKNVARQLLSGMTQLGKKVSSEAEAIEEAKIMSPNKFLRDLGFKLKDEKFEKNSFSIEFYNDKDCKEAYQELLDEKFTEYYNMSRVGKFIEFEDI
jgi:hypothetical protein